MLQVQGLSKRYQETVALEGATVSFAGGTVHTILGENGSGKSTLVKLLAGVIAPDGGEIRIDGEIVSRHRPATLQDLGMATVFQEVLVAPDRTVLDNILLGYDGLFARRIRQRDRREVALRALSRICRWEPDLDQPARSLALAERQLVVIARALVREPRILILDEATAALDLSDRDALFEVMEHFVSEGRLVLFISHRMQEVLQVSNRITVLRNGRVAETLEQDAITPERLLSLMVPAATVGQVEHGH